MEKKSSLSLPLEKLRSIRSDFIYLSDIRNHSIFFKGNYMRKEGKSFASQKYLGILSVQKKKKRKKKLYMPNCRISFMNLLRKYKFAKQQ